MGVAQTVRGWFGSQPAVVEGKEIVKQALERTRFTPDIARLQQRDWWLTFIYNEWQQGHRDFGKYLDQSQIVAGAAFTERDFSLWKTRLGLHSYPIIFNTSFSTVTKAPVKGQLYKVTPQQMIVLDNQMLNTVEFARVRMSLTIPYTALDKSVIEELKNIDPPLAMGRVGPYIIDENRQFRIRAWCYVGVPQYWARNTSIIELVDGVRTKLKSMGLNAEGHHLAPVRRYKPNKEFKPEYYFFSAEELKDHF